MSSEASPTPPSASASARSYAGSERTAATLPNCVVPSLALHRHVALEQPAFFLSPAQTRDASVPQPPLSACGLREGKSWGEFYSSFSTVQSSVRPAGIALKTLYFLRHARGAHNDAEARFGTAEWDATESLKEQYADPELTAEGLRQCASFAAVLPKALADGFRPQLVVTSPLRRTLHTSSLCLRPLYADLPVISVEHARETLGEHTCDRRSTLSEMAQRFPDVNFAFIADDADPLWTTRRETRQEEIVRAQRFMDFLFSLPEDHVVLVNHSGMLTALANLFWKPLNAEEAAPAAGEAKSDADVLRYLEQDGALNHEGISCRHCELQPFCVARLPLASSDASAAAVKASL